MNKKFKKIIQISIILSLLFMISGTPVLAVQMTQTQMNAQKNAAAKNGLDWGVQATKAVSKCAIGFGVNLGVSALANLLSGLISPDVATKDNSAAFRESFSKCISSVAIKLAKDQIVKITKSTLNWINTGLQGDSLFVQDAKALLNKTGNSAISAEIGILRDSKYSEMYPYGRSFASAQIDTARNMDDHLYALQSTLFSALTIDDKIVNTADKLDSYANNFAEGGWNGWLSLTQNPANNPLGFNMLASDQLAFQKEVAQQAIKDKLAANGGILDATECVQYGITKAGADANTATMKDLQSGDSNTTGSDELQSQLNIAKTNLDLLTNGIPLPDGTYSGKVDQSTPEGKKQVDDAQQKVWDLEANLKDATSKEDSVYKYTHDKNGNECSKYTTITPGSVIKDQVSRVLQSPMVQLEAAKTLDDGLGALMDGLLGKLQDAGIKGIDELWNTNPSTVPGMALNSSGELLMGDSASNDTNSGGFDLKDLGSVYTDPTTNPIPKGEGSYVLEYKDIPGYKFIEDIKGENGHFEPTTIKNAPVYREATATDPDYKKIYNLEKTGVIKRQTDYIKKSQAFLNLIPDVPEKLGKLDYCIPGPNPNWEENSQDVYSDIQSRSMQTKNSSKLPFCDYIWITSPNNDPVTQNKRYCLEELNAYNLDNNRINAEVDLTPYILSLYDIYKNTINSVYGPTSDMLNPQNANPDKNGKHSYLEMASAGQKLTAGLPQTAANVLDAQKTYMSYSSEAKSVIKQLEVIKNKYNAIIEAAQVRRANDKATIKNKLTPAQYQTCLDAEKLTP